MPCCFDRGQRTDCRDVLNRLEYVQWSLAGWWGVWVTVSGKTPTTHVHIHAATRWRKYLCRIKSSLPRAATPSSNPTAMAQTVYHA